MIKFQFLTRKKGVYAIQNSSILLPHKQAIVDKNSIYKKNHKL